MSKIVLKPEERLITGDYDGKKDMFWWRLTTENMSNLMTSKAIQEELLRRSREYDFLKESIMENWHKEKTIIDLACGSRMFWFDKDNPNTEFCDIREYYEKLDTGHVIDVSPTTVADFRNLPFENESFYLAVFDPPHLIHAGDSSWLARKYGKLNPETWYEDIAQGFREAMRVLKPFGTLIFKWNEEQIALPEILKVIDFKPLFGQKRAKTQWLVFMKEG